LVNCSCLHAIALAFIVLPMTEIVLDSKTALRQALDLMVAVQQELATELTRPDYNALRLQAYDRLGRIGVIGGVPHYFPSQAERENAPSVASYSLDAADLVDVIAGARRTLETIHAEPCLDPWS
jgi:hypothetical protein